MKSEKNIEKWKNSSLELIEKVTKGATNEWMDKKKLTKEWKEHGFSLFIIHMKMLLLLIAVRLSRVSLRFGIPDEKWTMNNQIFHRPFRLLLFFHLPSSLFRVVRHTALFHSYHTDFVASSLKCESSRNFGLHNV